MATAVTAGAALVVAVGLVLGEKVPRAGTDATSGRVHWMTKNTSRLGATGASATSAGGRRHVPRYRAVAAVLAPQDPVAVTAAAPLLRTVGGPLLLLDEDGVLTPEVSGQLEEWSKDGLGRVVVVGAPAPDGLPPGVRTEVLDRTDPDELFPAVNELLAREGLRRGP